MTDTHDWLSPTYVDVWVEDWTARPGRAAQLRQVAAALPIGRQEPIRVLDVGGGWGPLSEQVLEYRPAANVTLIDYSPRMLEHAARTLAPYGARARLGARDLTDPSWPEGLDGPFDAVVSALAIHNLRDPDLIVAVYRGIRSLLRPGSCFLNLEIVMPASPATAEIGQRFTAEGAGDDPDQVPPRQPVDPDSKPRPVLSVANQLTWLGTAGFAHADCLWRQAPLTLLAATA